MTHPTFDHLPKNAVGHDLLEHIPTATADMSVAAMIEELVKEAKTWDTINYIYVVSSKRRPIGVISIKELLRAPKRKKLKDVACANVVVVHPHTQKERAAMLAIKNDIKQVPVVDKSKRLVGVFGSDAVTDTLHERNVEDILRFSGVTPITGHIHTLLTAKVSSLIQMRAPWLVIGLAGGIAATFVIGYFEETLADILALAFFIPVVVYMGDAVGHQTQLIFIRSLGVEDFTISGYLWRELMVDFVIGIACAIALVVLVLLWLQLPVAAAIVGITMFLNILKSGVIAIGVPLMLYKSKRDPALGSGPFTTTVQDLLSIFIYFAIASLFLG
ncbi:MAG: magnesium transporter [Candidatus Uhrbacteria bacterium]|nr:magnesium transporter [Patescibacteria group bacterium]MBU1906540.1 magnesium transporter [Patescibacteria group bacterium]